MIEVPSGKKCMVVGCSEMVKARDLCATHYARSRRHGFSADFMQKKARAVGPERFCEIDGCGKAHVANGLCAMHYKRLDRHGDVVQTRASDWGAREKHPLYRCWNAQMRYKRSITVPRWHDLWSFAEDIGDSRPSADRILSRMDDEKPFGPGNVYWREPHGTGRSEESKEKNRSYARAYYRTNTRKVLSSELRKRYGITYDDYEVMLEAQGHVCAICSQPETRVDHRNGQVSRLAVDHDHGTGKVRGLLCHAHNNFLGHFGDDADLLASAITYLAKHSAEPAAVLMSAISKLQGALPAAGSA